MSTPAQPHLTLVIREARQSVLRLSRPTTSENALAESAYWANILQIAAAEAGQVTLANLGRDMGKSVREAALPCGGAHRGQFSRLHALLRNALHRPEKG